MRFFCLSLALILLSAGALPGAGTAGTAADTDNAATAIEVSGEVTYAADNGSLSAVELGQLFAEGDRLVTKENSSLHLVLADGSSLVLGPSTELTLSKLSKDETGRRESVFDLLKGAVNAMVEKLSSGSSFEIHTTEAVAAVKGTDFEVASDGAESSVTVKEGTVSMMDPLRRRVEAVGPFKRCLARRGSMGQALSLPKREAAEFQQRWERAHMIHAQRMELMKHFVKERKQRSKALRQRRKAARERFKKKREELKKEREEN